MLLWTLVYKFLCEYICLCLSSVCLGIELWGHVIDVDKTFWKVAKYFPNDCTTLCSHWQYISFNFSTYSSRLVTIWTLVFLVLVNVKLYLVIFLIGIFLLTDYWSPPAPFKIVLETEPGAFILSCIPRLLKMCHFEAGSH